MLSNRKMKNLRVNKSQRKLLITKRKHQNLEKWKAHKFYNRIRTMDLVLLVNFQTKEKTKMVKMDLETLDNLMTVLAKILKMKKMQVDSVILELLKKSLKKLKLLNNLVILNNKTKQKKILLENLMKLPHQKINHLKK